LQSCETDHTGGGCPKFATNYQTISENAISQTPYFTNKAFDTISFASNKGDTLTFVKTKTDTTWYCEDDNSNPNCPKEKANCYQTLHNTYTTIKGVGSFDVMHSKRISTTAGILSDFIVISFNNLNTFYLGDFTINDKKFKRYIASKSINSKTYYDLQYVNNNFDDTLVQCFINKNYGIFQIINLSLNETYDLITR
jgi:hypothetical protein